MRVLVIEDDAGLRAQLVENLKEAGNVVDAAADGDEGVYFGREFEYDAAVVDLGLPKRDGIAVIKALRELGRSLPILILTARAHWQDKVVGLEAGADDYLTKPFHMEELRARLNALMRRAAGHASPVITVGAFALDTARKEARVGDATDRTDRVRIPRARVSRAELPRASFRKPSSPITSTSRTSIATATSSKCSSVGCVASSIRKAS